MPHDERSIAAARAIYDVCYTLAPISFDEALRLDTLYAQRAIAAAEKARSEFAAQVEPCAA